MQMIVKTSNRISTAGLRLGTWASCALFTAFFLTVSPASAQYTWKNVTVPAGGYVSGIDYSPVSQNLIYMRTDMGGAYR